MKILSDRFSKIDKAGSLFNKNTVEKNILEVKDRVTLSHNTTTAPSEEVTSIAGTGFTESGTPEKADTPASFYGQKELLEILNNMTDENNNVKFVASKGLLEALQSEGSFDKTAVLVKTGVNILSIITPTDENTLLETHKPSLAERELKDEGMTDLLNFIHSIRDKRDKKTPCANTSISLKALCPGYIDGNTSISLEAAEPVMKALKEELDDSKSRALFNVTSLLKEENSPLKYCVYRGISGILSSGAGKDNIVNLTKAGNIAFNTTAKGYTDKASYHIEAAELFMNAIETEGDKHITALCKAVRDGNYSGFNEKYKAYAKLLDSTILEEKRNRHHRSAALLAIGGTAGLAMAFATFSHSMPVIGSVISALAGASFVEATIQHIKAMNI